MVGRSSRPQGNVKHNHSAIRMVHFFDVHTKPEDLKKLFRHANGIIDCRRSDHRVRQLVCDPQQEMPPSFIGKCDAILAELAKIELCSGFLEFQVLVFGLGRAKRMSILRLPRHENRAIHQNYFGPIRRLSPRRMQLWHRRAQGSYPLF